MSQAFLLRHQILALLGSRISPVKPIQQVALPFNGCLTPDT
jgi:hypothetical protein